MPLSDILEGCNFFINTDHKPLTFVMSSFTERPSLRQTVIDSTSAINYKELSADQALDA